MKAHKSELGKRITQDSKVARRILEILNTEKTDEIEGKKYKTKIVPGPYTKE